ncbi:unnamed protein product [Dicrocoelium dendriticum]|nr:unnamed protein product [Dicrocoelium dendriticum]
MVKRHFCLLYYSKPCEQSTDEFKMRERNAKSTHYRANNTKCMWEKNHRMESARLRRIAEKKSNEVRCIRGVWEEQTRKSHIEAETLRRFNQIKDQQAAAIALKKEQLREKLLEEDTFVTAQQKSPEQEREERCEEMKAKARHLELEQKLSEMKLAQEKYEQRFRNQCDLLRAELSKQRAAENGRDLQMLIIMKEKQKMIEKQIDEYYDKMLAEQQQSQQSGHVADDIRKAELARHTAEALKQQIAENAEAKQKATLEKLEEREQMIRLNQTLVREEEEARQKRIRKSEEIRSDLDTCLQEKRDREALLKAGLQRLDLQLAEQTLVLERVQKASEREEQRRVSKETKQYQNFVRQFKTAENMYQRDLEKATDEIIKKEYHRETERMRREQAARKALAMETKKVLNEQMELKDRRRQLAREENVKEAAEMQEVVATVKEDTRRQLEEQRTRRAEYRRQLEAQIMHIQNRRVQEIEEKRREQEAGAKTEAAIREQMDAVIAAETQAVRRPPWQGLVVAGQS